MLCVAKYVATCISLQHTSLTSQLTLTKHSQNRSFHKTLLQNISNQQLLFIQQHERKAFITYEQKEAPHSHSDA